MKKLLIINILLGSVILFGINACKKNNLVVDKSVVPPEYAGFNIYPTATNSYYRFNVFAAPSPGSVFKLPVGLTTVSNTDRKVKFTYSSRTAVAGAQYTAPSEITIPAGKTVDTLSIQGLFAGFATDTQTDTLKVTITNESGYASKNKYSDSVFLIMKRACPYDPNTFQGDFEVIEDEWADFSPGEVVTLTKVDNTHFSFIDPYATSPRNPIIVTVNTANNQLTVPKTSVGTAWGWAVGTYTGAYVATAGSSSVVSQCTETISLYLNYSVDAGTFSGGPYLLALKKL